MKCIDFLRSLKSYRISIKNISEYYVYEDMENNDGWAFASANKFKYPELAELFKFRDSGDDSGHKDAKCEGCLKIRLKYKQDRLYDHVIKCAESDSEIVDRLKGRVLAAEGVSLPSRAAKNIRVDRNQKLDEMVCSMIAVHALPLQIVEAQELKTLIKFLDSNYKLPSRRILTTKILPEKAAQIYQQGISSLKQLADYSLTIECDGWSSCAGLSIIAVVITSHTGRSLLLELIDATEESHTSEYLCLKIREALEKSSIPAKKFNCVVTDEASNYRLARSILTTSFGRKQLIEYRCMAHVFNLIGSSISRASIVEPILKNVATLISCLSKNKTICAKLKEMGAKKLIYSVPTRWYSTAASLNSVLAIKPFLERLPEDEPSIRIWGPILRDGNFWAKSNELKLYFNRLNSCIGQSEAAGSYLGDSFRNLIEFARYTTRELDQALLFRDDVVKSFLYHFQKLDIKLLLTAYALNPNHRIEYLTDEAMSKVKNHALALLLRMGNSQNIMQPLLTEFDRYLDIIKDQGQVFITDVHTWWKDRELPLLKIIGMRMACCHASSANTERIFSGLGRIITPSRNRLNLKSASDIMTLRIGALALQQVNKSNIDEAGSDQVEPGPQTAGPQVSLENLEDELSRCNMNEVENAAPLLDADWLEQVSTVDELFVEGEEFSYFKRFIDFDRSPLDGFEIDEEETTENDSDLLAESLIASHNASQSRDRSY